MRRSADRMPSAKRVRSCLPVRKPCPFLPLPDVAGKGPKARTIQPAWRHWSVLRMPRASITRKKHPCVARAWLRGTHLRPIDFTNLSGMDILSAASEFPKTPGRYTRTVPIPPLVRLALLVTLLVAAASSLLVWSPRQLLLQGFSSGPYAMWAAPAFVAVFALATLAFFPKPVLNAAAGVLFGVPQGLMLAVAGTTLGAALAFGLGRGLGRDALQPLLKKKVLAALDRRLTAHGFRSMLLLRMVPGIPFQAINFAAAFSGIRLWSFTAATAVGVLPGTAAYVTAGASASSPTSPAFLISTAVMVAMAAVTFVSLRRAQQAMPPHDAVGPA